MAGTGNSLMKNDNVCFVLHQHAEIAFNGISTLKEQSPHYPASSESKSIFSLIRLSCMLDAGVPGTNSIVSSLNRPGIKPTIYLTRGQHVKISYNLVQNGL